MDTCGKRSRGVNYRIQEVHKFNVRLANFGEEKKVRVGEMVEDKAVELATTMMTETFIYSVRPPRYPHTHTHVHTIGNISFYASFIPES